VGFHESGRDEERLVFAFARRTETLDRFPGDFSVGVVAVGPDSDLGRRPAFLSGFVRSDRGDVFRVQECRCFRTPMRDTP